jgi:hypothetical protein
MGTKRTTKPNASGGPAPGKKRVRFWIVVGLGAIAGMIAAFLLSTGKKSQEGVMSEKAAPVVSSPAREVQGNLKSLLGRWLRPDGGYVIEIRKIGANNKLDAGYFNPGPIHVSRAEASREGDKIKIFVELQDVGYPGSTYTLTYDQQRDLLTGTYFQAALQQTFEVLFVRTE